MGWYLRIFNLTHQKRSEAKVELGGHFKNMSKWLQITYLWMVWEYSCFWSDPQGQLWPLTSFGGSDWIFSSLTPNHPQVFNSNQFLAFFPISVFGVRQVSNHYHPPFLGSRSTISIKCSISWIFHVIFCYSVLQPKKML